MTLDAELSQSQEERLQEVIAAYLRDAEAGRNPDQAEILARHPELADELQSFFAGQEQIGRLAAPLRQVVEMGPDAGITGTLGDFRIVREVGRGGMGIVYEAEQISLRRRVALKVLPLAATMDARHLQRFHNEAQAAACLHHTNIVPVFSVGCERGVHFYAMQFIEGQPLSEIIRHLRRLEKKEPLASEDRTVAYRPSPRDAASTPPAAEMTPLTGEGRRGRDYYRKVAELGIQAAEALDHAHQLGIVHRDIKPGNLMLDSMGRLWVTDFGLAHVQHSDASLTLTGQALGTPRYMSPEQAMVKRVPIDHRTDVYSLGVTLYELLTLRPAFSSEDRHELLRQIAFEEPVKPRRLERGVPAELETIVLKAMEKRPQDRYATAQEMADDLRRFLDARPIRARRPTLVERAQKWVRRHPGVKWMAVAVLLVVTVAAVLSTAIVQREKLRTQAALAAEARRRQQARDALDTMTSQLMEDWLSKQEIVLPEHKALLEKALTFYEEFAADTGQDEGVRAAVASAHVRVGNIRDRLGLREAAETAYISACQLFTQLAADFPNVPTYRKGLADSYYEFGMVWLRSGQRLKEAEEAFRASLPHRQQLAADFPTEPEYRQDLALSHVRLGLVLEERDRLNEAEEAYRAALRLREELARDPAMLRRDPALVAGSRIDLAGVLQRAGRLKEAEENMRGGVAAFQQLAADFPTADNRWYLAWAYSRQGGLLNAVDRPKEAEEAYRAALVSTQQLVAEFPTVVKYREGLAMYYNNLAVALKHQGRLDEAIAQCQEAIRLGMDHPRPHANLGGAFAAKGQLDEAITEYRKALRLKSALPEVYKCYNDLGNVLYRKGLLDEAIIEYREALRMKPDAPVVHSNLGSALAAKGQLDEAIAEYQEALQLKKDFAPARNNLRQVEQMVRLNERLPLILEGKDQPKDAAERLALAWLCQQPYKKRYAAAVRFYGEAFAEEPKLADDHDAEHRYNAACAAALAGCGQRADADKLDVKERARLRQQALDWLRADLKEYRQMMEKSADKAGPMIAQRMQHWLQDGDFAGVRGDKALSKLPEEERSAWRKLWADVAEMLTKAQGKASPEKKPDTKSTLRDHPGA